MPGARNKRALERYAAAMADAVILQVRVKPRSRVSSLQRGDGGAWVAHVKAPPVDGKANAEVITLVASHFGCARSAVSIQSGASGRTKLVRVQGLRPA
jgi:uncharacterized protein (TIGR00251 family)